MDSDCLGMCSEASLIYISIGFWCVCSQVSDDSEEDITGPEEPAWSECCQEWAYLQTEPGWLEYSIPQP